VVRWRSAGAQLRSCRGAGPVASWVGRRRRGGDRAVAGAARNNGSGAGEGRGRAGAADL